MIAIIAQTEGDDMLRFCCPIHAVIASANTPRDIQPGEVFDRIPMMMIGGTAGIMCPHYTLFVNKPAANVTPRRKHCA